MDGAGLAIGLIGLPNDVLELHERWDSAKDFDHHYRQVLLSWQSSDFHLKEWILYAGFDGNALSKRHNSRLDDPDVFSIVKKSFENIESIAERLRKRQKRLRINPAHAEDFPHHTDKHSLGVPGSGHVFGKEARRSPSPVRGFLSWASHGKLFAEHAKDLADAVGHLYQHVPPSTLQESELVLHTRVGEISLSGKLDGVELPPCVR